nr:hypothetical protein GCM10020093_028070 [Planobispora longispora]
MIGLLAETARAHPLADDEVAALVRLAAMDEDDLEDYLLDLDDFRTASDLPVPAEARRRLVERLHRYGIRAAVEALRRGEASDAASLATCSAARGTPRRAGPRPARWPRAWRTSPAAPTS